MPRRVHRDCDSGGATATFRAMGTDVRLTVHPPEQLQPCESLVRTCFREVESAASRFLPNSELNRLAAASRICRPRSWPNSVGTPSRCAPSPTAWSRPSSDERSKTPATTSASKRLPPRVAVRHPPHSPNGAAWTSVAPARAGRSAGPSHASLASATVPCSTLVATSESSATPPMPVRGGSRSMETHPRGPPSGVAASPPH
jgi:hypothetical protein